MLRTIGAVAAGFAGGLWLRHRQRSLLNRAVEDAQLGVAGVLEAIEEIDVDVIVGLSVDEAWCQTWELLDVAQNDPGVLINATPQRMADMCRLTAADAVSRVLDALAIGSEVGPCAPDM